MWSNRPRQKSIFFSAMDGVVRLTTPPNFAKNFVVTVYNGDKEEVFEYDSFEGFRSDLEKFRGKSFRVESDVNIEKMAKRVQQILGLD
jgi:hypothetical protein